MDKKKEPSKKVKCACPGCGMEFTAGELKGEDDKLYCTREHADVAKIITGGK